MELQEILEALHNGEELSKEQVGYLMTSLSKASAGETEKGMKLEEFEGGLLSALDALRKSPEGQAQLKEAIAERKTQRFTKRYTPFFNALLAGADIGTSLAQVREAKSAIGNLKRPELPTPPGVDPALEQSIRDAQVGTMDAARAIAPARQVIDDQYSKDIALAKSIGGGQASTVGSLGQVASLRRARGAASLAPIMDDVRAREQGRLDGLINQRTQQTNQNYYNRFRNSQIRLNQFDQDSTAAGQLGSMGRLNLRNSMQGLLNSVPGVAARVGQSQGYGDKYSNYEQMLNRSLTGQPARFTENDVYGSQTPIELNDNLNSNAFYNPFS